ncbi:MAG: hypothetical protein QOK10_1464 [Pseudonocardiales bacterium]|jgi:hypothetical protein|nr:hypothetical protein [Pseudonocardiales bacterium]
MTSSSALDRSEWAARLAEVTKTQEGRTVTIEVLDETYGDNSEVERLPFSYADYDHKDDVVTIGVGGNSMRYPVVLRHLIRHPIEVDVVGQAIRVVDQEGTTTLLSFFATDA